MSFNQAREAWEAASQMRSARRRLKNFTYGRQWDDPAVDPAGRPTTEGEIASRHGRRPLTNNLLRALVKSVVGRFRLNNSGEVDSLDKPLQHVYSRNMLDELDARLLEEFIISGCAIQRIVAERRFEGLDVWVDNVNPNRFFCNRYFDPRGTDIRLVGMLHDMTLEELKMRFGHSSRSKMRQIMDIYNRDRASRAPFSLSALGIDADGESFTQASAPGLCRVIEVWTFETLEKRRGGQWVCRYYGPQGTLIDETPSPFKHGSHPFVVKLYPLTDGEVHPFIEDVIDQQRHINMLITTINNILNSAAKSNILWPLDATPQGVELHEIGKLWGCSGAIIPVSPHARTMPREISTQDFSTGASNLLGIEMKMFQQISGVTAALQGDISAAGNSASLYESQVQNATVALLDLYETFGNFRKMRNEKISAVVNTISH